MERDSENDYVTWDSYQDMEGDINPICPCFFTIYNEVIPNIFTIYGKSQHVSIYSFFFFFLGIFMTFFLFFCFTYITALTNGSRWPRSLVAKVESFAPLHLGMLFTAIGCVFVAILRYIHG